MSRKLNIVIADDHQLVLDGMKLVLSENSSFELVATAINGEKLLDVLVDYSIDILFLDINLPDINGLEIMKIIKNKYPSICVIGLSMMDDIHIIQQFVFLGAKGYLLKNSGKNEIFKAIETVSSGMEYFDQSIVAHLLKVKKNKKDSNSLFPRLSRREKEILQLIVMEYTTQEIANKLFIAFGTVETHRRNIINKLGVRNTAGVVRVAMEYDLFNK